MKKMCVILMLIGLTASSAMAATINVFGMDWETYDDGGGQYYTVNNPDSLTFGSTAWATHQQIVTPISINVGDVLSYDRYITETGWLGDYRSRPLDTLGGAAGDIYFEHTYNGGTNIPHTYTTATGWIWDITPGETSTGLHFEVVFDTATTHTTRITDIASGQLVATASGGTLDISTVAQWLIYSNNTLDTVTIENFAINSNDPPSKPGWTLDINDEFDGPTLNTDLWLDHYFPQDTTPDRSATTYLFRDGAIVLWLDDNVLPWHSSNPNWWATGIQSYNVDYLHGSTASDHSVPKFDGYATRYGYYEIRAKIPTGDGGHIAWWMIGTENIDGQSYAEIDIIENCFCNTHAAFTHVVPQDDGEFYWEQFWDNYYTDVGDEWHVFGFDWRPNGMKFYLDDNLVWETTQSVGYQMGTFLTIYLAEGPNNGTFDHIYPKEFAIDYFRVFKNDPRPGVDIASLVGTASMDSTPIWAHVAQESVDEDVSSYAQGQAPDWDLTVDLKNVYPVDKVIVRPETVGSQPITFTEDFRSAGSVDTITAFPKTSLDTGYSWSGRTNTWGLYLWNDFVNLHSLTDNAYGLTTEGTNAWTYFDGDYVANLTSIEFVMDIASDSDTVNVEAIIQDANGDWYVSDATAATVVGQTNVINATTTTWRTITAPVIGTAIVSGAAGTPDLSRVYGGGVNYREKASSFGNVMMDNLTFVGSGGDPPASVWADDYTIEVSLDNQNWTTVATASGVDDSDRTFNFSSINARYVRMNVTGVTDVSLGHAIEAFEVHMSATAPAGSALTSITEGFMPTSDGYDISRRERASADTAYIWSGFDDSAWGIGPLEISSNGVLDMSGVGYGYDNWNAWTVFNSDYVMDLNQITFTWHSSSTSGNLQARAIIQDANGDWFVSDDAVADTAGQTFTINATTTPWKFLNSGPEFNTALDIGLAGTPDLSKVYGGGLQTVGFGSGAQSRLDSLTFEHAVGAVNTIAEGFDSGGTYLDISTGAQTSVSTGYSWSGYHTSWGLALGDGLLDFSGDNQGYDNWNAWTVFDGDYVLDLKEIRAAWHSSSTSGNLDMKALIQDANGDWFVSDDVTSDSICCNPVIDATTTTWRILNSAPVINTPLSIASVSTPDLTKVYGGGLLTVGIGTGAQTRLTSLTFTNQISGAAPTPTISLDKSSYYSDEAITISWNNGPDSLGDKVEFYLSCFAPPGSCSTPTGPALSWADVSGTSGQTTIDNVLVPGDYVAVYWMDGQCAIGDSVGFSVTAGPPTGRDIAPGMLLSYCDGALADPQIYEEGGTYYITGTSSGTGGPIYSTTDFVTVNTQWMTFDTGPADNVWAFEIYKHTDGSYHGYGHVYLDGLYHWVPDPDPLTTNFPILKWKRGTKLTGGYDSKVIYDGSDLWLFSSEAESGHQKTFVQRMTDPDTLDSGYTRHSVMSENGDGLTSELRNIAGAMKIHEGAAPMQVTAPGGTKWVMPYTVGDYATRRYKIGFGYSDVLVPSPGTEYSKVTKTDTLNLWGSGVGANEVCYITQTEKPSWPNYHAAIYGNPGSGDIFEYNGSYYMLFHATQPMMTDDMVGGSSYLGRSLWVMPLDFDFSGSMDTWASLDLPDGEASPVLTPRKSNYAIDEDIVINFQNAGQGAYDYMLLYNSGDPDCSNFDWKYIQGLSQTFLAPWGGNLWAWELDTYGFSGSMTFNGLTAPGVYDARLFHHGCATPVAASCSFTVVSGGGDLDPPAPNPATFAIAPFAYSHSAVTMTATTGTDATGPVEYYFDETSGNPGGTDSGWVTGPVYTDTGLNPNTRYTYTVQMRDSATAVNVGTASSPANAATLVADNAVSYPDSVSPGVATAQYASGLGTLENDVITFNFEYTGGQLQNMVVKPKDIPGYPEVQINEPFMLTLGATPIYATDLTVTQTPVLQQMSADPTSVKLADHYPGWKVQMKYRPADNAYEVQWEAILRDESNYIQQQITITALTADLAIDDMTMVDMNAATTPGPSIVGNDAGCPVVADNYFLAYEYPITWNAIVGANVKSTFWCEQVTVLQNETLKQSSVVGLVPEGQLRRGFLYYLERQRVRPYQQYLHYNSWYDLAFSARVALFSETEAVKRVNQYEKEMVIERGVTVDGFVMDDPWDNPDSVWEFDQARNPQQWQNFKAAGEDFGASTGVWVSPFGGYGDFKARRLAAAAADPIDYETINGGFQLSGPNYNARYREACLDFIQNQGVEYFKFDGIGAGTYQTGPALWAQPDYEAFFDMVDDLRAVEPDLFINATVGSWHSPYYLMYADSVWRDGADYAYTGEGVPRAQLINYRDTEIYQNVANASPLFPLSSLMTNGIVLANRAPNGWNYASIQEFTRDVHSCFGMGSNLQEMYIGPDDPETGTPLMTEDMWDILAEAAKWARDNQDVFADAHWVGDNPATGNIYGVACWNPQKATLMLRNPSSVSKQISIDVDVVFELPNGAAQSYIMKSPWAADAAEPTIQLDAGTPYQFTLAPYEVLVLMSDGGTIPAASTGTITESFLCDDAEWNRIDVTSKVSAGTGYSWSGYAGATSGAWLYNLSGVGSYFAADGSGQSYEGVNAWAVFDDGFSSGADYVANLMEIRIKMAPAAYTNSGTVNIETIIQDANGDWFVSDDTVADTAGTTGIIDATTTTWRTIDPPVIGTTIVPGVSGTPNLSRVYGGGVNFRDLGTGYAAVRIDRLTFAHYETDPPTPTTASFAVAPVALSDMDITMTATTGTDYNGPVEYYFDETSGNPGGTDSGWQTSPNYTDTGLSASTQYTYTVQMRDAVLPTPNVGITSAPANATTVVSNETTVVEGFNPGSGQSLAISAVAQTSVDTGYAWSGRNTAWGLQIWDDAGEGMLDISGVNAGYDGVNAWTLFNGDYVPHLQDISFTWHSSSTSGNLNAKALIKDATGDWFVSGDTVPDTAGTTKVIDAITTTWKKLDSAPVMGTALDIGGVGTPDLTKVYGGGLYTVGVGTGNATRLDTLTFTGSAVGNPPSWNSSNIFKASAIEGLDYAGMLQTLAADASDPDAGDVLTFSMVSGAAWLNVATDGQLSGIAADGDTSSNSFTVRVTDAGGLYDEATLNIYVLGRYTGELGLSDLTAFASRWLDTDCGACGGADLDNDGDVNMQDWAVFAESWLK